MKEYMLRELVSSGMEVGVGDVTLAYEQAASTLNNYGGIMRIRETVLILSCLLAVGATEASWCGKDYLAKHPKRTALGVLAFSADIASTRYALDKSPTAREANPLMAGICSDRPGVGCMVATSVVIGCGTGWLSEKLDTTWLLDVTMGVHSGAAVINFSGGL